MATAKTTAMLISIGTETREVSVNFDLAATFASRGTDLPIGKSITVKRGSISKKLILTLDSFEDDPPGNLLRLNNNDIALFGFTLDQRITVEFNTNTNTMTLRNTGAK
ncbi:hypothetical protein [Paenibacillus montanisoli]|uniref:Uncharacterized protein n=1 Tax=Paenibacillus montanisoli TaxID=2081970 RepID=A0A328U3B2_9BACL|nr:hypothetical protein [Paenibacillus montanisoli]RAP76532.1 hypothetical protein DL346_14240 [Paenibacillus montanisoli]